MHSCAAFAHAHVLQLFRRERSSLLHDLLPFIWPVIAQGSCFPCRVDSLQRTCKLYSMFKSIDLEVCESFCVEVKRTVVDWKAVQPLSLGMSNFIRCSFDCEFLAPKAQPFRIIVHRETRVITRLAVRDDIVGP